MTTVTRTETLAQKVAGAMPDLKATEQQIAVGLYRLLAEGDLSHRPA